MSENLACSRSAGIYLNLMKNVLTDSLFIDHPLSHVVPYKIKPGASTVKRLVINAIAGFLRQISNINGRGE